MLQASQLLARTDEKIINVALDSGYRNLSIFNALFKKRFGVTPSRWRQQEQKSNGDDHGPVPRPPGRANYKGLKCASGLIVAMMATVSICMSRPVFSETDSNNRATNANPAISKALQEKVDQLNAESATLRIIVPPETQRQNSVLTNGQFQVRGYEVTGNTILPSEAAAKTLSKYAGTPQTIDSIREGLAALQSAYRERGFVTVAVSLPPQQLTNGIVRVQVVEGKLAEINVVNNHYFSSNNVMRELPGVRTNSILNGLVFQQELDRANANRDRQIYPVIAPGPEPGTSVLDLKVKDRLPLHAHFDINNYSTPNTPELRANFALVENNLWQLNHQAGFQYSFSPERTKNGNYNFYDEPLIANYSTFYRLPLSGMNGPLVDRDYAYNDFGFDEAAKRFRPPPASGTSELLFYASRSFADTGEQVQTHNLYPNPLPATGGIQIDEKIINRTLNPNETIGGRFTTPLHEFLGISSTMSVGPDFKNYRSTLDQNHTFRGTLYVPAFGNTGPPWDPPGGFQSPPTNTTRTIFTEAQYLPITFGWEGNRPDRFGSTSLSLSEIFNAAAIGNATSDFQAVAGSTNTDARFLVVTAGMTREQKLPADYSLRVHADGQWANKPLISNEQFSLGGQAGVRGYRDGTEYGDRGWRSQLDLRTPFVNAGLIFDEFPMIVRAYTFADYGERYLIDPGPRKNSVAMLGVGGGIDITIGEHFDLHAVLGVPLLDTPARDSGHVRVAFSLGTQF